MVNLLFKVSSEELLLVIIVIGLILEVCREVYSVENITVTSERRFRSCQPDGRLQIVVLLLRL